MEQHDCDESRTLFEIHAERSQNCHRFCKTLSQRKHDLPQCTAPLQLNCFKVSNKIAIAASAPVLPHQKKQCCKIARFTGAPCTYKILSNILLSGLTPYAKEIIGDHKCGFQCNRSNNYIFCTCQTLEKIWEYNETVYQLFTDFKKAYDSVRREVLYNIFIEFGMPMTLVRI